MIKALRLSFYKTLSIIAVLLFLGTTSYAATFTSAITGDWDDGATWGNASPGAAGVDYPSSTDDAIVSTGTTVDLTGNESIVNLTIQSGGILDASSNNKILTIDGNLDVDGTLLASNKDIIYTGGGTTIEGSGSVTISNTGKKFKIYGDATVLSTADIYFFCNVEMQNNDVVTNNGTVSIDEDLLGTNGNSEWINAASSTLAVSKTIMSTGILTASANENTVTYLGDDIDITTPAASTYYNLTITANATKTKLMLANLIVSGDVTLVNGILDCDNFNINIGGDWNNSGGAFTEGTGKVIFDGGAAQAITSSSGETFYDWQLTGGGTVTINTSDVVVSNVMTMTSGNIVTGSNKITLGTSPGTGTLSHTSGTIIGYFERWLSISTGISYRYPVGTEGNTHSADITFNAISNDGSVIVRFVASGPGNNGLSLVDGAATIYNSFVDGYWEFTTANSFASNDFDLLLTGTGFTAFTIDADTRILTRADAGSAWTADGTHVNAAGSTAKRDNVTTLSGHYCFGDDTNCSAPATPTITSSDDDICTSTTGTYQVTNTGNTFSWSIFPASAGTFNPAPAAGDFSVDIDWGTTGGNVSVICIESNGCTSSEPDTLAVSLNSIAPTSMTGRTSVAVGTTGESYSIDGIAEYTYTWTITGGTLMIGQGTSSVSVDWNNTVEVGQVSVVAQSDGGCAAAASFDVNVTKYEVINSNGSGGGDWNTATTWDCNCVPASTDNVRILTNDVVSQGNYVITINNMITQTNATFERLTNNRAINVTADLIHDGLMTLASGNQDLNLSGVNAILSGFGTINITTGGTVNLSNGNKSIDATAILTISGGDVNVQNSGIIVTNNGSITITDNITVKDASNQWINAANSTLNLGGDLDASCVLNASSIGNTVNYNGAVVQNVVVPASNTYYNLSSSTSNVKELQGALDVNGDLLITGSSQLDANGLDITLAGDWTNNSAHADPFVEAAATVTFDGTASQTINSINDESFNNLTINNTSTGIVLAAFTDIDVDGVLTLTDGVVDSRINSTLVILSKNSSTASASSASYVEGLVRKVGNTVFEFPIGDNGLYAPTSISAPSVDSDAFDSEYYYSVAHDAGYDSTLRDASVHHISQKEYWMVNRTAGASNVFVTLGWDDSRSGTVNNLADMIVSRWDGAKWADHSNGGTTGNTSAGTVTTLAAVTSFSPFTLGSGTANNPLPINLLYFDATLNVDQVELAWETSSEINNDYFTVERSTDGINWEDVLETSGAGNSSSIMEYFEIDMEPIGGKSYYRLRQTDFDGNNTYSNIVPVKYEDASEEGQTMVLYPNPSDGESVNLEIKGFENYEVLIVVRDIRGQELYSKAIMSQRDGLVELLTLDNRLPSGTYLITASSEQKFVSKKLIVR